MSIEIREVLTKADQKQFVQVQFDIYKGNKYWVPPIKADEVKALTPEGNPAFDFCKAKFWLAFKSGKCVGRIGAIINEKYIEKTGEKYGRFSRLEFIDDHDVVKALTQKAEEWIKEQGMKGIQGPLGFTNLDHQAMLIEGFDHLPSIASEYHHDYYKEHLEKLGYEKEIDWVEFRLTLDETIPEKAVRLNKIIQERNGLTVRHFTKSSELEPYGEKIFEVLNDAFAELFSVIRFDKKMIDYYKNRYFKLLNPKFVKVVENKTSDVVAFIVGLPSLSRAMQKANGKLFPFGFWHIMQALKKPKEVDLLLTGITPDMQGSGVAAILITELQQVMLEHGVKHVETTGIFETNQKAIQNWKNYNHIQHKRKRCFKKDFK